MIVMPNIDPSGNHISPSSMSQYVENILKVLWSYEYMYNSTFLGLYL